MGVLLESLSELFGVKAYLDCCRLEDRKLFDIFSSLPVCPIDRVVEGNFNPLLFSMFRSLQRWCCVGRVRTASHRESRLFCERTQWFIQLAIGALTFSRLPFSSAWLNIWTEEKCVGLNVYGIFFLELCQPVQADVAPRSNIVIPDGDGNWLGSAGHLIPPAFVWTVYHAAGVFHGVHLYLAATVLPRHCWGGTVG